MLASANARSAPRLCPLSIDIQMQVLKRLILLLHDCRLPSYFQALASLFPKPCLGINRGHCASNSLCSLMTVLSVLRRGQSDSKDVKGSSNARFVEKLACDPLLSLRTNFSSLVRLKFSSVDGLHSIRVSNGSSRHLYQCYPGHCDSHLNS